jgi:hypothetical protein
MGLTPEQFWGREDDIETGMSLREFDIYSRGYQNRISNQQELLAWHAANIMNMWTKKGSSVSPAKLLGKDTGKVDPKHLQQQLNDESKKERKKDLADSLQERGAYDPTARKEEMGSWVNSVLRMAEISSDDDTLDDAEG